MVIDWLSALRGDPAADVVRTLVVLEAYPKDSIITKFPIAVFLEKYLKSYIRKSNLEMESLLIWKGPLAAARFYEGISGEEGYLMKQVELGIRRYV